MERKKKEKDGKINNRKVRKRKNKISNVGKVIMKARRRRKKGREKGGEEKKEEERKIKGEKKKRKRKGRRGKGTERGGEEKEEKGEKRTRGHLDIVISPLLMAAVRIFDLHRTSLLCLCLC